MTEARDRPGGPTGNSPGLLHRCPDSWPELGRTFLQPLRKLQGESARTNHRVPGHRPEATLRCPSPWELWWAQEPWSVSGGWE